MGEFGLQEILKQFLAKDRASDAGRAHGLATAMRSSRTKKTSVRCSMFRIRLASDADAARFFGAYSELLELKNAQRTNLMRRPNFFSFDTPEDGVFIRCMASDCFILEGGTRALFDRMTAEMGWPAGPIVPVNPGDTHVNQTGILTEPALVAAAGSLR